MHVHVHTAGNSQSHDHQATAYASSGLNSIFPSPKQNHGVWDGRHEVCDEFDSPSIHSPDQGSMRWLPVALAVAFVAARAWGFFIGAEERLKVGFELFVADSRAAKLEIAPNRQEAPVRRELSRPGVLALGVGFDLLHLLPGDVLVLRGIDELATTVVISDANQSLYREVHDRDQLWDYPLIVPGDRISIEYYPSLPTLLQPMELSSPVAIIDSFVYMMAPSEGDDDDTLSDPFSVPSTTVVDESIIGNSSEMKEAICFKKSAPQMYAKAKAVARLLIRDSPEDPPYRQSRVSGIVLSASSSWAFCTGWILGRGNYVMTNYHCVNEILRNDSGAPQNSSDSGSTTSKEDALADVNFQAETKTCADQGYKGEKSGVIEGTQISIIAANRALDYALVEVVLNRSSPSLSSKYGYLTVRSSGPVDGEPIYIPQHPNGQPKEIAATKNCMPAVIHMLDSSDSWSGAARVEVWYNADTLPGSSGSPVISQRDNTVVALHHAGGASWSSGYGIDPPDEVQRNYGVRADAITRDLKNRGLLPPCAVAVKCGTKSSDPCCSPRA